MIEEMMLVKITGLKQNMFEMIRTIKELGVLHLSSSSDNISQIRDDELLDTYQKLQDVETRISVILTNLPPSKKEKEGVGQDYGLLNPEGLIEKGETILKEIEPNLMKVQRSIRRLEDRNQQIQKYQDILGGLEPLVKEFHKIPQVESIVVVLDKTEGMSFTVYEERIGEITEGVFQLVKRNLDENFIAILTLFDKEYLTDVQKFLFAERVSEMRLPTEFQGMPVRQVTEKIKDTQSVNETEIEKLKSVRTILSSDFFADLTLLLEATTTVLSEFEVVTKIVSTTNYSFELTGFLPKSKRKMFLDELTTNYGDKINIEYKKLSKKQTAPVLRKNPPIIRSFEVLTNLIGLPKYGTIDPTPLMAILFTFFWGFMVGDMGYGLIILAMMTALPLLMPSKFESQTMKDLMTIFKVAAISSIVFGFLYGEVFGDLGEHYLGMHPIILNRYDQMIDLLLISVMIGYVVILFGLFLGIVNNMKLGNKGHARADAALLSFWGSIFVAIVVGMIIPSMFSTLLMFSLIFSLIMMGALIWMEKLAGIIHVIERFSNILSFARLMAIGLVGAEMAYVANQLSMRFIPVFGEGLGLVVGISFALGLHLINIMILILSPTIHSLRLNVYEFFSQFSKTGDVIKYAPYQSI